jgi:hypothetical protein
MFLRFQNKKQSGEWGGNGFWRRLKIVIKDNIFNDYF